MNACVDTTKMREAYQAKLTRMAQLNAIQVETGETFTAEEQTEYDGIDAETVKMKKRIEAIESANARISEFMNVSVAGNGAAGGQQQQQAAGQPGNTNLGTKLPPANSSQPPKAGAGTIIVKDPEFTKDPKGGFEDGNEFFNHVMMYGEMIAQRRSGYTDPRIEYFASANVAKRLGFRNDCSDGSCDPGGSTSDLTGSVFVPKEFAPDVYKTDVAFPEGAFSTTRRQSRAMSVTRKYRLDKDHRTSVTGGFQVGRNYEHCCNQSSANKHSDYTTNLFPMYGAYCASDMLLEQNPQLIIQEVEEGFKTEFQVQRLVELLNGTGTGEYLGVWNSKAIVEVTPEGGVGTEDITKLDIYSMGARLWRGSDRSSLVWIAGLGFITALKMLQDSNISSVAHFLYDPNGGPDWADGLLDGIPIVFTELVPGITFRGGLGLYNWKEFEEYTWKPLRNASSIHARFICNETLFKFWQYTGGQPRWNSTMIPKCVPADADVNDHTLAPFVLLAGNPNDCPTPSRVHSPKKGTTAGSSSST